MKSTFKRHYVGFFLFTMVTTSTSPEKLLDANKIKGKLRKGETLLTPKIGVKIVYAYHSIKAYRKPHTLRIPYIVEYTMHNDGRRANTFPPPPLKKYKSRKLVL